MWHEISSARGMPALFFLPQRIHGLRAGCLRLLLAATFLAGSALRAAQLPPHVTDQPIELHHYPLTEVGTELGKLSNEIFTSLRNDGVEPFANYWGTYLANPVGGQQQGTAWAQLLVFGTEIHFDNYGWQGGSVFISATDFAGTNLSQKVGNVFTLSQAVVIKDFNLYSLYFKQQFWGDKLELRLGRLSAGQVFASLPIMGLPVGGAVNGNPTSLFTNSPFHATGVASWAAYAKFMPTSETYVQAGIFQASPQLGNPANHGVNFSIQHGDGELLMFEAGWIPKFGATEAQTLTDKADGKKQVVPANPGLPGQYTFGAYYSNYTFATFSGGVEHNTYGFYAQAQQMLWRSTANANHTFTLWGGLTYSPQEEIALLPVMGYGGVVWQGLIPTRDKDSTLLNYYIGGFSSSYARQQAQAGAGWATTETVLEASYCIQLSENFQFQPDLQWVINPGGFSCTPNALVVGFQVSALF